MSYGSDIVVNPVDLVVREAVLSDPNRMEKIFKHLASGGTIIDYCKLVCQPYSEVMAWINSDDGRRDMYSRAKTARQDWLFERVLEEYKALSTLDIRCLYNDSGGLKPMSEWPDAASAAVAGVESLEQFEMVDGVRESVGELKKIKTYDKTKTLEALGKYLRMFAEVIEIRGEVSIRGALDEAEARMSAARVAAGPVIDVPSAVGSEDDEAPI
jgi:hypothetical protein